MPVRTGENVFLWTDHRRVRGRRAAGGGRTHHSGVRSDAYGDGADFLSQRVAGILGGQRVALRKRNDRGKWAEVAAALYSGFGGGADVVGIGAAAYGFGV